MLENAYASTPIPLRLEQVGEQLKARLKTKSSFAATQLDLNQLLKNYPYQMVGGRTLSIKKSDTSCLYIKFKKLVNAFLFGTSDNIIRYLKVFLRVSDLRCS